MVEAILLPSLAYSELLATKQTKGEPFDATLARCLKLTLQCEKELDEPEVHQMCIDNRLFDLKYALHTTPVSSFAMLCWQTGELERALAERNADQTARDTRRFGVSSKGCRPKERTAVADTDAPHKKEIRQRRRVFLQLRPRLKRPCWRSCYYRNYTTSLK